ncbi:tetratricopeptide repeat protein [Roseivivax sp. CAU 1753]
MSLPEARSMALELIRFGHVEGAEKIIAGLLKADPDDVEAHYLIAKLAEAKGDPKAARQAAGRMFRLADAPDARFAASSIAARAALAEDHYTTSQFWLRRAYQSAPDDRAEAVVARDYARVRAANPFRFSLKASVTPSSNVNDGSSDEYNTIAGQDAVGILSGSAQALDGVETRAELDLSYRIAQGDLWRTTALYQHTERRVALSEDARDQAPDLSNEDFAQTTLEAGLRHEAILPGGRVGGRLNWTGGRTWYGGEELHDFQVQEVEGWLRLTERLRLSTLFAREIRMPTVDPDDLERYDTVLLGLSFALPGGGKIGGTVTAQTSDPSSDFQDGTAHSVSVTYAHGRPVLGMGLSGYVSLREEEYPDYIVGVLDVPGGRQDQAWTAGLSMAFTTFDYAGFIPEVSITAQTRDSNVSRFDTEELSVSFGIKSAF